MTNLDNLATIIDEHRYSHYDEASGMGICECGWGDNEHTDHIAQAILDAGWQAPEEIFKP